MTIQRRHLAWALALVVTVAAVLGWALSVVWVPGQPGPANEPQAVHAKSALDAEFDALPEAPTTPKTDAPGPRKNMFVEIEREEEAKRASSAARRYVAVEPGKDFGNFLWVLDTQTGKVSGYRIAQNKTKNWGIESLEDWDYLRFAKEKYGATRADGVVPPPLTEPEWEDEFGARDIPQ
jgi:hypothetical protein